MELISTSMKIRKLILTLICFTLGATTHSQVTKKETIENNGLENKLTITETGMYEGTDSKEAKKYFDKAAEYSDKQDYNKAEKFYLKAIKKDPKYIEAYDNLGLVYRRIGDFDKAVEFYKKSIELYPSGQMSHQNLAVVYVVQKDYNSAIQEYNELLKISPNNPEGYFGIANSYMLLSKFDDALKNAKTALELYKEDNSHHLSDSYYLVGLIYHYTNDKENAKRNLQLAKDSGAKIHQQIAEIYFPSEHDDINNFSKEEKGIILAYNWLLETPIGEDKKSREALNAIILGRAMNSPNVKIELNEGIISYVDCSDCFAIFLGGYTAYAIKSKDYNNKFKGNLAGTEGVIEFYIKNKKALGPINGIEKLIKLKQENMLEDYIKSKI
jgi:tetratricopeptide (TPR) repeat protein